MSKVSPRYAIDMAEHSMCHPGLPRPHGDSHCCRSPGFAARQSAKSKAWRLFGLTSTRAPAWRSSGGSGFSRVPYPGNVVVSKYTPSAATYAFPFAMRRSMRAIIAGMCSVAFATTCGSRMFSFRRSTMNCWVYRSAMASGSRCSRCAPTAILSTPAVSASSTRWPTSVMFMTCFTPLPKYSKVRRAMSAVK